MNHSRAFLLTLSLLLCGSAARADLEIYALNSEKLSQLKLQTASPEPMDAAPLAEVPGRIVLPPSKEFSVTSLQGGIIRNVYVSLGEHVQRGQVLAEIESVGLVELQRGLIDAHSILILAQSKLARDQTLFNEGIIAKLRLHESQSNYERAYAAARAAEQSLMASGMTSHEIEALKTGRAISNSYRVISPSNGIVLDRQAIVGQRIEALSPLFRVGDLHEIWLELDVPQEKLKEVQKEDLLFVRRPEAQAKIIEVSQSINLKSQTGLVRGRITSSSSELKPGMHVNVQMMHRSSDQVFRIPRSSLFSLENHQFVFIQEGASIRIQEVLIAWEDEHWSIIHEGLRANDAVVIEGTATIKSIWLEQGSSEVPK